MKNTTIIEEQETTLTWAQTQRILRKAFGAIDCLECSMLRDNQQPVLYRIEVKDNTIEMDCDKYTLVYYADQCEVVLTDSEIIIAGVAYSLLFEMGNFSPTELTKIWRD